MELQFKKECQLKFFLLQLCEELQLYFFTWELQKLSRNNFNHETLHDYFFVQKLCLIATVFY